jgi:hypothetical protein
VRVGFCTGHSFEPGGDVDGLTVAGFIQVAAYGFSFDALLDILFLWDELSGLYPVESVNIFATIVGGVLVYTHLNYGFSLRISLEMIH